MFFTHEARVMRAVRLALPSVVSVAVSKDADEAERSIPGINVCIPTATLPRDEQGKIKIGGGSGFVISDNGLVLTNKHVVLDPKATYAVYDQHGTRHEALVVGRDPIHDLAVLRIKSEHRIPPIRLGTARGIHLGQTAIAIGTVLGEFQSTVSTGVVSGLSRFVTAVTDGEGHQERLRGLIQTDAAINPGNSGGPLLNIKGEVIGINAAVVFGAQNIGFAIPIDKVKRDLHDILEFGRIRRPYLGIRYFILNPRTQKRFHFPVDHGAVVVTEQIPGDQAVIPGSPAARAGITEGDIIVECNGTPVTTDNTLEDQLENYTPGEKVELQILKEGKYRTVTFPVDEWK